MGQASSTFVEHPSATVEIPGKGKLVGRIAQDLSSSQFKSQRFSGIPYAQPPLGPLRWRRPQPLAASFRYDHAGKQYSRFADQSPQPTNYALSNGITFPNAPVFPQSEDCLYLNVWCPTQSDGSRKRAKLPVLFFIHGGWLQIGNAHFAPDGDPSDLMHKAGLEAVIVTTAYRLNAFGFFAHDALRKEDAQGLTGNYGFWDQRAALEWVYNNIEHFGGDPENVTVSGLSAGAHSAHSQLMHEYDLSTANSEYTPIIRRVFLQSNAAIWPSKSVEETAGQLDELCSLLDVPTHLGNEEKIEQLRQVDGLRLVRVLAKMDMHTFRATRDAQEGAFVKPDWTRSMMSGSLARWCQQKGISFVMGECDDEAWVYRYINTPRDREGLVRQVNNYYALALVDKMLPHYGVSVDERKHGQKAGSGNGNSSAVRGESSLYSVLGVRPSATTAEIRTAYLAKVRIHHPDKLQQQGLSTQVDASTIADSPSSDDLIWHLNHAYKTLLDDQLRSSYDESLARLRASSAKASSPRISATIDFESFQPLEAASSLVFSHACRCGSSYNISEEQIHEQIDVIPCDGCSENIRVRYDFDDHTSKNTSLTPEEVGEVFGRICSDSQVYIAQRMFVTDLLLGQSPEQILRYRINYRARAIDSALSSYRGVSHSFDDFVWWFSCLEPGEEQQKVKTWLEPWKAFIQGQDASADWYQGKTPDGRLIRVLEKDGSVSVERDERWVEKEELIEAMLKVRRELVEELL